MIRIMQNLHLEAWTNGRPFVKGATIATIGTPAWMGRTADLEADALAGAEALCCGSKCDQEPPTTIGLLLTSGGINSQQPFTDVTTMAIALDKTEATHKVVGLKVRLGKELQLHVADQVEILLQGWRREAEEIRT